ncbi:hypothetical protein BJ875DRAFT_278764 [Amylocarpus encephaloides]|uniref:Uncharacterized protein n=1 Tax=Amylocarpus encephaloides TaxID=45428 RepID=A0A9P7YK54_9HELO|nr:hypothetical protein BJ875DRAFT_278764 [Amylocarpus encephaloides]
MQARHQHQNSQDDRGNHGSLNSRQTHRRRRKRGSHPLPPKRAAPLLRLKHHPCVCRRRPSLPTRRAREPPLHPLPTTWNPTSNPPTRRTDKSHAVIEQPKAGVTRRLVSRDHAREPQRHQPRLRERESQPWRSLAGRDADRETAAGEKHPVGWRSDESPRPRLAARGTANRIWASRPAAAGEMLPLQCPSCRRGERDSRREERRGSRRRRLASSSGGGFDAPRSRTAAARGNERAVRWMGRRYVLRVELSTRHPSPRDVHRHEAIISLRPTSRSISPAPRGLSSQLETNRQPTTERISSPSNLPPSPLSITRDSLCMCCTSTAKPPILATAKIASANPPRSNPPSLRDP